MNTRQSRERSVNVSRAMLERQCNRNEWVNGRLGPLGTRESGSQGEDLSLLLFWIHPAFDTLASFSSTSSHFWPGECVLGALNNRVADCSQLKGKHLLLALYLRGMELHALKKRMS